MANSVNYRGDQSPTWKWVNYYCDGTEGGNQGQKVRYFARFGIIITDNLIEVEFPSNLRNYSSVHISR